jgi:multiple sugar transport system ATP-binding protein
VRLFGEHRYDVDDVVYATPDKALMHRFGADDRVQR